MTELTNNSCNKKRIIKAEIFTIRGKVKYARVHKPQPGNEIVDQETGETKKLPDSYSTGLIIDESNRKQMLRYITEHKLSRGIKPDKEEDEVFYFIRPVETSPEGNILNPITNLIDDNGDSIGAVEIGNGSDCTVAFRLKPYKTKFGNKNVAILVGLQVHNLIPYERPVIVEENVFGQSTLHGGKTKKGGQVSGKNPF